MGVQSINGFWRICPSINKIAKSTMVKKHAVSIVLFFSVLVSFFSVHMALLAAFIFTFLVPGLISLKIFRLKLHETPVFVLIFSVMSSTYLIYFLAIIFGYSRETVLMSFLFLAFLYTIANSILKEANDFKDFLKTREFIRKRIILFIFVFLVSVSILWKSVWFESENGIIITGSNWQDTPLHYSIIESINNGNFPPQMPYFSGVNVNYHYFVDLHTAVLEKVYIFTPKLLPILNASFIFVFALAIYSLARVNGEKEAAFSTIIAIFGWGFSYFNLFSAALTGEFNPATNYSYQYDGFFGLPPIFDNLLQQRPLLVGLPAFAFVLNLLRDSNEKDKMVLAGVITGLLFPFHVLSFFCCFIAYFFNMILNIKDFKLHHLYFLVSAVIALPFLLSMGHVTSVKEPWSLFFLKGNPVIYYTANLGFPFLVSLASLFFKKINGKLVKCIFVVLFLIPSFVSFTPNPWDMYKFFHFAWVPISVLSGTVLAKLRKEVAALFLALSVLSSICVITYNLSTNYVAANWDEYNVGMWIRNNTEERSVFLTYYSIHSPPAMIGGRLRVLSYLNWPYGHGVKLDEIFERMEDVNRAYNGSVDDLEKVVKKYGVKYIYVGVEELKNYPDCFKRFDKIEWLKTVYDRGLKVYEVHLG